MPSAAPAALVRAFRNKDATQSAAIAHEKITAARKSSTKKVEEAEALAEEASASARWHGATTAAVNVSSDLTLETIFAMSETMAKYELYVAGGTTVLGAGLAFLDGYGGSAGLGVASAGLSRLGRLGIRKIAG